MVKCVDNEAMLFKLNVAMDFGYLYKDPDLCLTKLAAHLGVHYGTLSLFIKNHYGINFRTYLNKIRIDKLIKIMNSQTGRLTVVQCMEVAGFKSRVTFFHAFKNVTGKNTSEYYDSIPKPTKSDKFIFNVV